MTSPQINLVVIRSPDIDRAVTFYQTIGLTFTKHAHGSGPQHYACDQMGCVFEIYPASDKTISTESTRIGFSVSSVDETVTKLLTVGAAVIAEPKDSPWGRRAVMSDFDGHRVEITAVQSV